MEELQSLARNNKKAVALFLVQRGDCQTFSPALDYDPHFFFFFSAAMKDGVQFVAYSCVLSCNEQEMNGQVMLEKPLNMAKSWLEHYCLDDLGR